MSQRDKLQCQLAGLAALESTVRLAVRALYASYPEVGHQQRDDELCETTTARWVVELAEDLLCALDDHRAYVLARLKKPRGTDQTAWPF
jgi:hypothetical protein